MGNNHPVEMIELPLIAKTPSQFKKMSIEKLKSLPIDDKLKVFYTLEYPDCTWFYHNVIGIGEEHKLSVLEKMDFFKHLGEMDLYYFAKYILKKDKLRERPNRLMCEKIMIRKWPNKQERKLICEPRGTYKSTIGSIAFPIWKLCKDHNISIQIDSETDKQAHDIYKAVRVELEQNELLKEFYGKFQSNHWNETSFAITQRSIVRRDPSCFHSGVDSSVNGVHPDLTIIDDPCSEQNTQTLDSIDRVHDHIKLFTPLVDKKGEIVFILTRWVIDDIAGRIIRDEAENFSILSIKSCYGENGDGKDISDGLYAPDVLPAEYLEAAKRSMGMWRFSANYLNDPKPDADKSFKMDWLRYYEGDAPLEMQDDGSLKPMPLSVYMGVDASWADKSSDAGRDPTAIVIIGFNADGDSYLLDYMNKRISPTEVIEKVFQYVEIWNPLDVATEDIGTQKGLNLQIEQEMVKRKKYFTLNRVKHQARSKNSRIMSLAPIFQNGTFYIKKDGMREFVEQYQYFNPQTKLTHDDILDAVEMVEAEYREIFAKPDKDEDEFLEETFEFYDPKTGRM